MRSSGRSNEPYVKPVKSIELSEKHIGLRFVAFILAIVVAVGALTFGVISLLNRGSGWRTVNGGKIRGFNYDEEIVFEYNAKDAGEFKRLQTLYSSLLDRVAPLFDADNEYEGISNICYINRHPNEQIVIDELLYSAFEVIDKYDLRSVYTGPFYEEYKNLFFSYNDDDAESFDPDVNKDVKERAGKIAAFAKDKNSVQLKLLGKNTVTLYVSGEYENYVKEIGSSSYIDLWLIKNAFIIDYCADIIVGSGYYGGRLSSFDGYLRVFDKGNEYTYNVYDMSAGKAYVSADMTYDGVISAANPRVFPLGRLDDTRIYVYEDGRRKTSYLDPTTCSDRYFVPCFTVYSYSEKCAEVAAKALVSFISENGTLGYIERVEGFEYVYSENFHVKHSEKNLKIKNYLKEQ